MNTIRLNTRYVQTFLARPIMTLANELTNTHGGSAACQNDSSADR